MTIERIYISHTIGCSGWNLDKIYEGTIFRKAITTKQTWEEGVKMLDWDFKHPNSKKHIRLAREHEFEVVMAPDIWNKSMLDYVLSIVGKLFNYCKRVVIPIHYYCEELEDFELAFPNTTKFNPESGKNLPFMGFWQNQVTHILGGTPERQLSYLNYFPNVKSLDGNLIFRGAISYGKYWCPEKPKWRKPIVEIPNQELFKISVMNLDYYLKTNEALYTRYV